METRSMKRKNMGTCQSRKRQKTIASGKVQHKNGGASETIPGLPDDIVLHHVFAWLGGGYYRYVAPVCKAFKTSYIGFCETLNKEAKCTKPEAIVQSPGCANIFCNDLPNRVLSKNALRKLRPTDAVPWPILYSTDIWFHILCFFVCFGNQAKDFYFIVEKNEALTVNRYCPRLFELAAAFGNMSTLEFLKDIQRIVPSVEPRWEKTIGSVAASKGHLHVLVWLQKMNYRFRTDICSNAAVNGHLHVLEWAVENGIPWDEHTCYQAAKGGHLDILRWARRRDCPWNVGTSHAAAMSGHVTILKWIKSEGCEFDVFTAYYSFLNRHKEAFIWLRRNGCSFSFTDIRPR